MKKLVKCSVALMFIGFGILAVSGCGKFHSYEGEVGHRSVTLHFKSDQDIDRLWAQCDGKKNVQAFAIRQDDGSCEIWMRPPKDEDDAHFMRVLYHELGHCEEAAFGTTHHVEDNCAQER